MLARSSSCPQRGQSRQPSKMLTRGSLGEHRVGEARPGLARPVAEVEVGEAGEREPCVGIDPEERRRCGRSGRTCAASCARPSSAALLPSRSSKPRPQSFGSCRPKPGRTPARPGNWTAHASSSVSRASARRLEQLVRDREQLGRAADRRPSAGRAGEREAPHAPRSTRRTASPHARPTTRAEHVEAACSSRCAAPPAASIGVLALERQAGGVREQVAHRRAGRAGGLVEVDDPLLRRDEHGDRRSRASSPTPRESSRSMSPYDGLDASGDRDGGVCARPRFDLREAPPSRRHYPRWIGS